MGLEPGCARCRSCISCGGSGHRYGQQLDAASLSPQVSTICILIAHFQTCKIVISLQLPWPPNVIAVGSSIGIDLFAIELPEALRWDAQDAASGDSSAIQGHAGPCSKLQALACAPWLSGLECGLHRS